MWSGLQGQRRRTMRLTRAVPPAMLEAGRGSIVNIAQAALRGSAAGSPTPLPSTPSWDHPRAFMYGPNQYRVNRVRVATGIGRRQMSQFGQQRTGRFWPHAADRCCRAPRGVDHLPLSDDAVNISVLSCRRTAAGRSSSGGRCPGEQPLQPARRSGRPVLPVGGQPRRRPPQPVEQSASVPASRARMSASGPLMRARSGATKVFS